MHFGVTLSMKIKLCGASLIKRDQNVMKRHVTWSIIFLQNIFDHFTYFVKKKKMGHFKSPPLFLIHSNL